MEVRRWYERKYLYSRVFGSSSRFDSFSKRVVRWGKYLGLVFALLFSIFSERISRIAKIDFEKLFNQLPPFIRTTILSLVGVVLVSLMLLVFLGWVILGIVIGISVTKPAAWSFFYQTILSNTYVFLIIFFSIIFWIVNFYLKEYFEKKSESTGKKEWRYVDEKYYGLGRIYGILSSLLGKLSSREYVSLKIFFFTFLIMILAQILARYFWGISL